MVYYIIYLHISYNIYSYTDRICLYICVYLIYTYIYIYMYICISIHIYIYIFMYNYLFSYILSIIVRYPSTFIIHRRSSGQGRWEPAQVVTHNITLQMRRSLAVRCPCSPFAKPVAKPFVRRFAKDFVKPRVKPPVKLWMDKI